MGAGASLNIPEQVDKATAKALAGNAWTDEHEKAFDDAAADGMVTKAQFEAYLDHTTEKRCFGTGCGGCGSRKSATTAEAGAIEHDHDHAHKHDHDHDHDHAHKHDHDHGHQPAAATVTDGTTDGTAAAASES